LGEEIKKEEEEIEKCKIRMIIKIMSTIQSTLIVQDSKRKNDMGAMIGSIKQEIKDIMGNNIPNEVIEKTFEQLGELSDSLKSYFDQLFGKMEQIGEDVTAIR
jgi:S-adenosylmethionine synthetase